MALTTVLTPNQVIEFSKTVMTEYFNQSGFAKYTNTSANAIVQIRNEFINKPAAQVNFPVLRQLTGDGVSGSKQLWGNEEVLPNSTDVVTIAYIRNGTQITNQQNAQSEIDILNQARPILVNWAANKLRKDIMAQLCGVLVPSTYTALGSTTDTVDDVVAYASATAAQKATHFANNSDRIYAGGTGTVTSETDIADKAASITSVDDYLAITAAIRNTLAGSFGVRPVESNNDTGTKTYVWFVDNYVFSKIKAALASQLAMADVRGTDNDLMQNGDLYFDGVVVRLIPELQNSALTLTNSSSASVNVHRSFVCGAQAILLAYGARDVIKMQTFDYEFQHGVSIACLRGLKKSSYNGVEMGVMEIFSI